MTLAQLRIASDEAFDAFRASIAQAFGCDEWTWYRAHSAVHFPHISCARNEDTTRDKAMANHQGVIAAHDHYIMAIHAFYRARDGERGVLGSRGL